MQVIVMVSLLIRVEKYERQDYDEKLPLTYGLVGQETCVPGSIAYGLRFITGIIELIDYMQQYPPDAWMLSYNLEPISQEPHLNNLD